MPTTKERSVPEIVVIKQIFFILFISSVIFCNHAVAAEEPAVAQRIHATAVEGEFDDTIDDLMQLVPFVVPRYDDRHRTPLTKRADQRAAKVI